MMCILIQQNMSNMHTMYDEDLNAPTKMLVD